MFGSPLEEAEVLRFEKRSLGNEPEANRRWVLQRDGALLFSKNEAPVAPDEVFNTPLQPLRTLPPEQVERLLQTAREAGFWEGPRHTEAKGVEGGMRQILSLRDGERTGELVADNVDLPAITRTLAVLHERP